MTTMTDLIRFCERYRARNVNPVTVALLFDCQDLAAKDTRHSDGSPFTDEEVALVQDATEAEYLAAERVHAVVRIGGGELS